MREFKIPQADLDEPVKGGFIAPESDLDTPKKKDEPESLKPTGSDLEDGSDPSQRPTYSVKVTETSSAPNIGAPQKETVTVGGKQFEVEDQMGMTSSEMAVIGKNLMKLASPVTQKQKQSQVAPKIPVNPDIQVTKINNITPAAAIGNEQAIEEYISTLGTKEQQKFFQTKLDNEQSLELLRKAYEPRLITLENDMGVFSERGVPKALEALKKIQPVQETNKFYYDQAVLDLQALDDQLARQGGNPNNPDFQTKRQQAVAKIKEQEANFNETAQAIQQIATPEMVEQIDQFQTTINEYYGILGKITNAESKMPDVMEKKQYVDQLNYMNVNANLRKLDLASKAYNSVTDAVGKIVSALPRAAGGLTTEYKMSDKVADSISEFFAPKLTTTQTPVAGEVSKKYKQFYDSNTDKINWSSLPDEVANQIGSFAVLAGTGTMGGIAKMSDAVSIVMPGMMLSYEDAYSRGKEIYGDDALSASTYALASSYITGLTEMIMPDRDILTGGVINQISKNFVKNYTKQGRSFAYREMTKTLLENTGKEITEEFVDRWKDVLLNVVVNLSGGNVEYDAPTINEQLSIAASTAVLTGLAGTGGAISKGKRIEQMALSDAAKNYGQTMKILSELESGGMDVSRVKQKVSETAVRLKQVPIDLSTPKRMAIQEKLGDIERLEKINASIESPFIRQANDSKIKDIQKDIVTIMDDPKFDEQFAKEVKQLKPQPDAIQEPETESVDARQQAETGETMGEGNAQRETPKKTEQATTKQEEGEVVKLVQEQGEQVQSLEDAEIALGQGDRVFAFDEMENKPIEITDVTLLKGYAADQIVTVSRFAENEPSVSPIKRIIQPIIDRIEKTFSIKVKMAKNADEVRKMAEGGKFSIVGEKANLPKDKAVSLDKAKTMESDGKSSNDIWEQTGWERGKGGGWNTDFESPKISELFKSEMAPIILPYFSKITGTSLVAKLGDVVDINELSKIYPDLDLGNMEVIFIDNKDVNYRGGITEKNGKVTSLIINTHEFRQQLQGNSFSGLQRTITHELQHVLQNREGMPVGTSIGQARQDRANALREAYIHIFISDNPIIKRIKAIGDFTVSYITPPNKWYEQNTGEVQSRNAAKRDTLTPAEKAKTPISETEDVSRSKQINKYILSPTGEILGATLPDGTIVLNEETLNPNTPMHEAGHLWQAWVKQNNPQLYQAGLDKVKNSPYLAKVKASKFYQAEANKLPKGQREEFFADEALAMAIGDNGALLVNQAKQSDFNAWLDKLWQDIAEFFGIEQLTPKQIDTLSLEEFSKMVAARVLEGKPLKTQAPVRIEDFKSETIDLPNRKIQAYHATPTGDVKSGKEAGIHLGTQKAATRIKQGRNNNKGHVETVTADIKNPLVLENMEVWDSNNLLTQLFNQDGKYFGIDESAIREIRDSNITEKEKQQKVIDILKSKGFDAVVYKNTSEDKGNYSIVVFDENQLTQEAENLPNQPAKTEPVSEVGVSTKQNLKDAEIEAAKDYLAKGFDGIMNKIGGKKNLTPEQRTTILEDLLNLAKGFAKLSKISIREAIDSLINEMKFGGNKTLTKDDIAFFEQALKEKKRRKRAIQTKAYEGAPTSELQEQIEKFGLNYEVESHEYAKQAARDFINEVGEGAARTAVVTGQIRGGAATFVFGTLIDNAHVEVTKATNDADKIAAMAHVASLIDQFDTQMRLAGREISAIHEVYKSFDFPYQFENIIKRLTQANNNELPSQQIQDQMAELVAKLNDVNQKLKEQQDKVSEMEAKLAFEKLFDAVGEEKSKSERKSRAKNAGAIIRKFKQKPFQLLDENGNPIEIHTMGITFNDLVEALAVIVEKAIEVGENIYDAINNYLSKQEWYNKLTDKGKQSVLKQLQDKFSESTTEEITPGAPTIDGDGNIVIPFSLIRSLVEGGVDSIEELTTAIYDMLSEQYMDITERDVRDAITKYGKQRFPSKDEVLKKIAELNRDGQLLSGLEDVLSGKAPLRTGQQRAKPTDKQRELTRKIKDAMKELPEDEADVQRKWATVQDRIETLLNNRINDLNEQLAKGEREVRNANKTPLNEANQKLRDEVDRLNKQLDDLVGKKELTEEQRVKNALDSAERELKKLNDQITEGDLSYKVKRVLTETAELRAAREKVKQARSDLNYMRKIAGVAEAKRIELYRKRTQKQINDLNEQLRTGNYDKKPRKEPINMTEALLKMEAEKLYLKEQVDVEVEKQRLKNRSRAEKTADFIVDAIGIPKSLMATADLSALLRQGAVLGARHPIMLANAFTEGIRFAFNEKKYEDYIRAVKVSPMYPLMKKAGLYISTPSAVLSAKEEQFMSNLAHKIPFWGTIIKASERAYSGQLNKLRIDVFMDFYKQLEKDGYTGKELDDNLKGMSRFINNASGRGQLDFKIGKTTYFPGNQSSALFNALFFAPKFVASRFGTLAQTVNAMTLGIGQTPKVRKEIVKTMVAYAGLGMVILALAKAGGADSDDDPKSTNFGKIVIGGVHLDIWGGFQQVAVLISRLLSGAVTDSVTDETKPLNVGGHNEKTYVSVLSDFLESKMSPPLSYGLEFGSGEYKYDKNLGPLKLGERGDKPELKGLLSVLGPIWQQDIYDIYEDEGLPMAVGAGAASFFGIGEQYYLPPPHKLLQRDTYDLLIENNGNISKEDFRAFISKYKEDPDLDVTKGNAAMKAAQILYNTKDKPEWYRDVYYAGTNDRKERQFIANTLEISKEEAHETGLDLKKTGVISEEFFKDRILPIVNAK